LPRTPGSCHPAGNGAGPDICKLARDLREQGTESLLALIRTRRYRRFRSRVGVADLRRALVAEPELIDDWLWYSVRKRTTAGWVFDSGQMVAWTVRQPFPLAAKPTARVHRSRLEARADFVLSEFNYWLDFEARRPEKL
jgi:hypothetical protein